MAMSPRLLVLAIAPLFAAATAHAQAPGETEPSAPQPVAQDPCACSGGASVMAKRWAVGLSVGSLDLAPENNPDARTQFSMAQLSVRYRATRHLELEVALAGGTQVYEDGSDGNLAMNSATLGARYRFRPEQRWSWWLMGGLGATVVASKGSTQQERDQLSRPHATFGIGLEHRWTSFAIQAEARAIGVGELANDAMTTTVPPDVTVGGGGSLPPSKVPPPGTTTTSTGPQSGGAFTIGASYYF